GKKGYIGCGAYANLLYKDFYEYDWPNDMWTQKADYPGGGDDAAAGFAIGTTGYIGLGSDQVIDYNDFWSWDLVTDSWTQLDDFPGDARSYGIGFSIGDKGYFALGGTQPYYNDYWEFTPDTTVATDVASPVATANEIFPNPNSGCFMVMNLPPENLSI